MELDKLLPDEILALTLYGEARGEPVQGQIAVANVIMNRLKHYPSKYKTVADVCLAPKQFSCWDESDPNYKLFEPLATQMIKSCIMETTLKQCLYIARGVIGNQLLDNTKAALNYMTIALFNSPTKPSWADNPTNTPILIGKHTFFNV